MIQIENCERGHFGNGDDACKVIAGQVECFQGVVRQIEFLNQRKSAHHLRYVFDTVPSQRQRQKLWPEMSKYLRQELEAISTELEMLQVNQLFHLCGQVCQVISREVDLNKHVQTR